eukprot:TRINITY_DN2320_c0_g2_i1.p1 TRINITY_DN2320_c0_g2~~TRINITY_DN2320_c0_g2_i1.p1  ORF type:complete len:328 (+),score=97.87 TRINITY_DN2320_c0_g2_i1:54-1037(+)
MLIDTNTKNLNVDEIEREILSENDSNENVEGSLKIELREENEFVIESTNAYGGFATVYNCRLKENNQMFVLKQFNYDREQLQIIAMTIEAELNAFVHLKHPNIISLLFVVEDSFSQFYSFAFPYYEYSLADFIQSNMLSCWSSPDKYYFLFKLLGALEYIHSKNYAHLDLTPRNILLNEKEPVLTDFGNCVPLNECCKYSLTTLAYRSPERLLGYAISTYSMDVWAFGCVAFLVLVGEPLFDAQNEMLLLKQLVEVFGFPEDESFINSCPHLNFINMHAFEKIYSIENKLSGLIPVEKEFLLKIFAPFTLKRLSCSSLMKEPIFSNL